MGFLDSFERRVERVVGGAFAKAFTSGVHPLEIVAALKRDLDARAQPFTRTRVLAPHVFRVGLSATDHERLARLGEALLREIEAALSDYVDLRRYATSEALRVSLEPQAKLVEGMVDVRSDPLAPVVWIPSVTWNQVRYPLTRERTAIGRGTDCDVHVVAPGVSRHHAEIRWNGKRSELVDLGSTNGTTLDGEPISRAALPDSCTVGVGRARILFHVVPLSQQSYNALAHVSDVSAEET